MSTFHKHRRRAKPSPSEPNITTKHSSLSTRIDFTDLGVDIGEPKALACWLDSLLARCELESIRDGSLGLGPLCFSLHNTGLARLDDRIRWVRKATYSNSHGSLSLEQSICACFSWYSHFACLCLLFLHCAVYECELNEVRW